METKENLILIRKAKDGDTEAIKKVIDDTTILIKSINKTFGRTEDGFQEGVIAVYKAIESYDISYNVKFSTYAYNQIKGAISNYYRKEKPNSYNKKDSEDKQIEDEKQKLNLKTLESRMFLENLIDKSCTDHEQNIIRKIYFEDTSESDLSIELKLPIREIVNIKQRALAKLRNYIK